MVFFVDITFRHYDLQSVNWWDENPRSYRRKEQKSWFDFQKKKAKWFGYALWRLAYYLGLNFRNQTNYFDHSYTHCSKGVVFQKGHEIFFLPSFVSFVIIVNITLKPLTNYSEYSFKSAELICFFQCKVFFLHSDA